MIRHRHTNHSKTPCLVQSTNYPTAAERTQIIQKRRNLCFALTYFLVEDIPPGDPQLQQLIQTYGLQEVNKILLRFSLNAQEHDTMLDDSCSYRIYRQSFARFGGLRPFLSRTEHDDLQMEYLKLFAPRNYLTQPPIPPPTAREEELYDLILEETTYWEDITPSNIPSRPDNYPTAQRLYPAEIQNLLDLNFPASFDVLAPLADRVRWQPLIPELLRVVFAPDLLHGWPGEATAWGPWQALYMLGLLGAVETAPLLLNLMKDENDWLSDRLPAVWSKMGPAVSPYLWLLIDDASRPETHRAQAAFGLLKLAYDHLSQHDLVINGLVDRINLYQGTVPSLNAYIVYCLSSLKAHQAEKTIRTAFKRGWVNERIMTLKDVAF